MTIDEVAQFLRIGKSKIYGLMDAGLIRFAKFGKSRRIPRAEVERYAAQSIVSGPAASK
jgi:excisionase family DNA binding protein